MVAKENGIKRVFGIDYSTSFPFDEVMNDIENAGQSELKSEIQEIFKWADRFDNKIESGSGLADLLYHINSSDFRSLSNK